MRPTGRSASGGDRAGAVVAAVAVLAAAAASAPVRPAAAQEPPVVTPGEVATVPVSVPLTDGAASPPAYRVRATGAIRLFGSGRGTAAVEGRRAVVAVTFQAAGELAAGVHRVARVVLEWPDGAADTTDVRVRVPARRRLEAGFVVSSATVGAGGEAEVGYRVVNRGNARDTVRLEVEDEGGTGWRFVPRRSRLVVDPGRADTVPVRVHAPSDAGVGAVRRLRLLTSGRGSETAGVLTLHVVERAGWVSGVEHVPGRVFLGSSVGHASGGAPGVLASVRAGGAVGGGTRLSLEAHHRPDGLATPRPLRREAEGPEVRVRLERPSWEASAGDVFARADPLAGSFLAGRGADVRWEGGGFYGEVFAALPTASGPAGGSGHSVMGAGGMELEEGRVGVVASDHETSGAFGSSGGRTRSVAGRLELGSRSDRFVRLELGMLRLRPDSGSAVTGPAAEGEVWLSDDEGYLSVRGRTVPGRLAGGPTLGDELFVGGRRDVAGPVAAVGRATLASGEGLAGRPASDVARVEGGASLSAADVRIEGLARWEEADVLFPVEGERTRRSVVLSGDAPVGPLFVDARVELGRETTPRRTAGFRRLGGTVRWQSRRGWAWLTAGEEASPAGTRRYLEAEGGWEKGRVRLSGGASAESGARGDLRIDAWSRVALRVTDGLSVVGGVERDASGFADTPWSVSLGVQKGLDLPLPLPESAVSHGVVFEDLDGDGRRDPGERGLEGVRLSKGFVEVVTDRRGRFEIDQEAVRGRPLRVDAASLPGDAVVTPGARIPGEGEAAVPVLRTSRLVLRIFVDRDGDGVRGDGEPAASDAVVELTGPGGRRRIVEADEDGRATAGALRPGTWGVRVRVPETRRRLEGVERLEVRLAPGSSLAREVPVRARLRPVR